MLVLSGKGQDCRPLFARHLHCNDLSVKHTDHLCKQTKHPSYDTIPCEELFDISRPCQAMYNNAARKEPIEMGTLHSRD